VLILASFTVNLGFSALSPLFPYIILAVRGLLRELPELTTETLSAHKGAVELGLLAAVFMAARAPTAGIVGFLSDATGKKLVIAMGMALYLASSLGFLASNNLVLFMLFRGLQGAASAMVWPVAEAYLAEITPRWSRGKAISAYTSSMLIAQMLGPSVGVAVYKLYATLFNPADVLTALKAPIAFLAAMCSISLLTVLLLPPLEKSREAGRAKTGLRRVFRELGRMPGSAARSLKVIYGSGLVNGIAMGILNTAAITYIIEVIVKDPLYLGIFFSTFFLAALPSTLLAGYLSDRIRRRKPLVLAGYTLGNAVFLLIPFIKSYTVLLVGGAFLSLIFGLSTPTMRALQADLTPRGVRGSVFGLQQLVFNAVTLIGALAGGYLVKEYAESTMTLLGHELTGYVVPFWIAGVLGLLTTAFFALYVEE